MTPQRAREIRIHWMTQVSPGERSYDQMIEQAILAACREERYATLTEAAESVEKARELPELTRGQVIVLGGIVLRILALRDQEKP